MPRPPPRPLCLPELIANPQTRLDFIEANPPKYGPIGSRPSSFYDGASNSSVPASPTSTNDAKSYRTSGTTSTSLMSPVPTASTRTSLSVHNLPWNGEAPKRSSGISGLLSRASHGGNKGWNLGNPAKHDAEDMKPRASWSSAFSGTKSWFGTVSGSHEDGTPKPSNQKEIKLSPSMIAAGATPTQATQPPRPMSSPYPIGSPQTPRVGTGLKYYSERNPAPDNIRVQIPDPIDEQTHDQPSSEQINIESSVASSASAKASQPILGVSVLASSSNPDLSESSRPTRDSNLPDIRVSYGGDS